ncbi:hypothetical protein D3C79_1071340 [compost metagenome]
MQAETHHYPFQLGEAEQVIGLFGGAVGGFLRAAIEQQDVLVVVQFEQGGRERAIAPVDMGVDQ